MRRHNCNPMELRQLTGMSQQELASLLHVSRTAIAMHESTGRGLPTAATIYYHYLLRELQQTKSPTQKAISQPAGPYLLRYKEELQFLARQKRLDAAILKHRLDKQLQKEKGQVQRRLLVHCMEKVQARLEAAPGQENHPLRITGRHKKWLELEKKYEHLYQPDEAAQVKNLKDRMQYNLLLKEAEEAEKLLQELK